MVCLEHWSTSLQTMHMLASVTGYVALRFASDQAWSAAVGAR